MNFTRSSKRSKYFVFLFVIFCFSSSSIFTENVEKDSQKGLVIVAMGLPGSGKSSVFRELSMEIGASFFSEPEEKCWPAAVINRELSGNFSMLTWFRSIRVPMLFQADLIKKNGGLALVDSYYDKLLIQYLGKEGMEWLMSPDDPYYDVVKQVALLDWEHLPNADVLVFFDIDFDTWMSFLKKRNRKLDNDVFFLKSYATKNLFWNAAEHLAKVNSPKIVRFAQKDLSPHEAALNLKNLLIQEGVLKQ
jgi:deoxyadenosine/deoxycytidine kinase